MGNSKGSPAAIITEWPGPWATHLVPVSRHCYIDGIGGFTIVLKAESINSIDLVIRRPNALLSIVILLIGSSIPAES
jgi:hypothetical protein